MEDVGEDRGDGEEESQYIQPQRRADRNTQVFAETELQQNSGQPDGSDDDQGERAKERGMAGVDDHHSECEQE